MVTRLSSAMRMSLSAGVPHRIDCFMEKQTPAFGEAMKAQVEERLRFYDEGIAPSKNIDAMQVRSASRLHPRSMAVFIWAGVEPW